jgi:hypothetical protein
MTDNPGSIATVYETYSEQNVFTAYNILNETYTLKTDKFCYKISVPDFPYIKTANKYE